MDVNEILVSLECCANKAKLGSAMVYVPKELVDQICKALSDYKAILDYIADFGSQHDTEYEVKEFRYS